MGAGPGAVPGPDDRSLGRRRPSRFRRGRAGPLERAVLPAHAGDPDSTSCSDFPFAGHCCEACGMRAQKGVRPCLGYDGSSHTTNYAKEGGHEPAAIHRKRSLRHTQEVARIEWELELPAGSFWFPPCGETWLEDDRWHGGSALPPDSEISLAASGCPLNESRGHSPCVARRNARLDSACSRALDRKSTRLNSSHLVISYAVFCLKKKRAQTSNSC